MYLGSGLGKKKKPLEEIIFGFDIFYILKKKKKKKDKEKKENHLSVNRIIGNKMNTFVGALNYCRLLT